MPRPATDHSDETVVTLRLPRELHARLKQEADAAKRGFAAEVRQRLEASISPGADDPETRRLLDAIARSAAFLAERVAPWHKDAIAFAGFKRAIDLLLFGFQPPGEPGQLGEESVEYLSAILMGINFGEIPPKSANRIMGRLRKKDIEEGKL